MLAPAPVASKPVVEVPVVRPAAERQLALDWLRGLVMVLMTVDHASGEFNAGRLFTDATFFYKPGMPLPLDQFLVRWVTHLCAPTFVFLAGFVLLGSVERRRHDGESEWSITRFIVTRGLFIAAMDPIWMRIVFPTPGNTWILQVLYAIGMGLVAVAFLRWIAPRWLGLLGLAIVIGIEPLAGVAVHATGVAGVLAKLLVVPGPVGHFFVGYPLLPWLGIMLMGWGAADLARRAPELFRGRLLVAAAIGLVVFVVVRGLNGWGNLGLLREDGSLVQWLHTSKYPPAVSYVSLEMALSWLLLAAFMTWKPPRAVDAVLRPLGQSALFFYLIHAHLLFLLGHALGMHGKAGLGMTFLSAALVVAVMVPACNAYRKYKLAHPTSLAQYV
jgi:uncharacterized membrane protein